jgi:hypothetical protein
VLVVTGQGAAVAASAADTEARAAVDGAGGRFSSSFESGDPQPAWRNTVETVNGAGKTSGVDGTVATGIPGNVSEKVTKVRANGEYEAAGEVKENLVDGDPSTKWLVFEKTGWVEFDLAEPVTVVRYALTSANDAAERNPKDWTLKGSNDGKEWTTLDSRADQVFTQPFQTTGSRSPATRAPASSSSPSSSSPTGTPRRPRRRTCAPTSTAGPPPPRRRRPTPGSRA